MSAFRLGRNHRRGNVAVLFCVLLPVLLGMAAFAIDLGVLRVARTEAQRAADAAALAAAWELIDEEALTGQAGSEQAAENARKCADEWASRNRIFSAAPRLAPNPGNAADGDAVVGTITNFSDLDSPLTTSNPAACNAVQVRVRRTAEQNGEMPLIFGRIFGTRYSPIVAQATAGVVRDVKGFRAPGDASYLPILPITLHEESWKLLLAGGGRDDWSWDRDGKQVGRASDGILEVNLYPLRTGASGNFGTLNIGRGNNARVGLSRQILDGLSAEDLVPYGGKLVLENGELTLTGDPGVSAAIGRDLESIRGQTRILPIHRNVSGQGANAAFTIVKFVGVRILDVNLSGNSKHLTVQPANIVSPGVIAGETGGNSSDFVYSKPYLVR